MGGKMAGIKRILVVFVALAFAIVVAEKPPVDICPEHCNCTETKLDCSNRNLTSIPLIVKPFVYIDLSSNNISVVKNGSVSNMPHLLYLDLSNNTIDTIETGAFMGLANLTHLNISQNENLIVTNATFPEVLFEDLLSLVELKMYGTTSANLPYTYPNEALGHLVSLKTLWMDGMMSKKFGEQMTRLSNLTHMEFPGDLVGFGLCDMGDLNGTFDTVTSLTHLRIIKCGLVNIDKNAFIKLRQLKFLDLSYNRFPNFTTVTQSFASLQHTSIDKLVLNHITGTSYRDCGLILNGDHFKDLAKTTLTELYLENNGIVKASGVTEFKALQNLKILSLRGNALEFDLYIFYTYLLKNISELDISYQFFDDQLMLSGNPVRSSFTTPRSHQASKEIEHYRKDTMRSFFWAMSPARRVLQSTEDNDSGSGDHVCKQLAFFPPIVPFIPEKIEYVDSSHSKMKVPVYNISFDDNYSLKRINASDSMLLCWEGPVYGLHALQYLDLSNNFCSRVSGHFFDRFGNLTELNIAYNFLSMDVKNDTQGKIMKNLVKLEKLDISSNRLQYIPPRFLWAQNHLVYLNLSYNMLASFDIDIEHMTELRVLDLCDNVISTFSKDQRQKLEMIASQSHLTVNLTGNSLHCYCKNIEVMKWLKRTRTTTLTIMVDRCSSEKEEQIEIRDTQELDRLINRLEQECASHLDIIISATAGGILVTNIVVGILVYRYRWKLRYWYYVSRHHYGRRKYRRLRPANDAVVMLDWHIKFDVFVVCSEDDARGEFVEEMYSYMHNENQLRLFETERDVPGNRMIYEQICLAIHQSHVTIFVLSKQWLEEEPNGWWKFALGICREEARSRGEKVHFSIIIDGLSEHHNAIEINPDDMLDYPNRVGDRQIFWTDCVDRVKTMIRGS